MFSNLINTISNMKDKIISGLLQETYNFFNSKFPSENYNIESVINDYGYSMKYRGVRYNINFFYMGSLLNPTGGGLCFNLRAELNEKKADLEKKIEDSKISNRELDKTAYLSNQKIEFNCDGLEVECRIKRIPKETNQLYGLCSELWGHIIKNIFISINS